MSETTIAAAAICLGGTIYSVQAPGRHHDVIGLMAEKGIGVGDRAIGEQGFVASDGEFYGRVHARRIAGAAGQIKGDGLHPRELFSEDLW